MNDLAYRRLRRLRRIPALRALVRETRLSTDDFIYPLFIAEQERDAGPVASMPGVMRHTLASLEREVEQLAARKIRSVLLFGIPAGKDAVGSGAYAEDGVIPQAIRRIKAAREDMIVITDVCLCEYTDHGHCGVLHDECVDNDATLPLLSQTALAHAAAGADIVAPSAMMDGMVGAIRRALDAGGHDGVGILSYSVKYASSFYGPFREAAACAPKFGDRRTHQMDPANAREALAEAEEDLREGADLIMVKPGMPYLDVISALRQRFPQAPLAAYQVSGEYSMIKAAAERGWLDERRVVLESLTAIKRAGADIIITYFAKDAAEYLAQAHD